MSAARHSSAVVDLARKGDPRGVEALAALHAHAESQPVHREHDRLLGAGIGMRAGQREQRVGVIAVHVRQDVLGRIGERSGRAAA